MMTEDLARRILDWIERQGGDVSPKNLQQLLKEHPEIVEEFGDVFAAYMEAEFQLRNFLNKYFKPK